MTKARTNAKKTIRTSAKIAPITLGDGEMTTGSQADYDTFLPAAKRLSAAEIIPMRADPQLALHNVQLGVASVLAESARLSKLPETNHRLLASLPQNALAVIFATTQLVPTGAAPGLAAQIARGNALRGLLLKTADALVEADLLPRADVDKIRAGRGKLDAARDLVALDALFKKYGSKIKGKHAVTSAQLKEASEVGTALLQVLKPGRARRSSTGPALGAEERDRLWTLLVSGHDALWRAGAYLFGRDSVDARVPPLQANRGGRPKKASLPGASAPSTPGSSTPAA